MGNSLEFHKQHGGPIFEPGPGWGARLSKWFQSSFTTKVLPVLAILVIILVVSALLGNSGGEVKVIKVADEENITNENLATPTTVEFIEQIVQPGDGYSLLARRAILDYTVKFDVTLTKGQRMYIEDTLSKTVASEQLNVGKKIIFKISDLETLTKQAQELPQQQLQIWENYAIRARI